MLGAVSAPVRLIQSAVAGDAKGTRIKVEKKILARRDRLIALEHLRIEFTLILGKPSAHPKLHLFHSHILQGLTAAWFDFVLVAFETREQTPLTRGDGGAVLFQVLAAFVGHI